MKTPYGWDKRDYDLWSELQQLPSYGLIAGGDGTDRMISRHQVVALLMKNAAARGVAAGALRAKPDNALPPAESGGGN